MIVVVCPLSVDVPMKRRPLANWVLIGLIVLCFPLPFLEPDIVGQYMVLPRGSPSGMLLHVVIHTGWFHLIGNLIFLWIFGNAVCAKLGNFFYALFFFGSALLVGAAHLRYDGDPAAGASGAISAVLGMFLVFYARNNIRYFVFAWMAIRMKFGIYEHSSVWAILGWVVFDLVGLFVGEAGIAYKAHLAGYLVGFVAAFTLSLLRLVRPERYEEFLTQTLELQGKAKEPERTRPLPDVETPGAPPAWFYEERSRFLPSDQGETVSLPQEREGPPWSPPKLEDGLIKFRCSCGKTVQTPAENASTEIRCPYCDETLYVPDLKPR